MHKGQIELATLRQAKALAADLGIDPRPTEMPVQIMSDSSVDNTVLLIYGQPVAYHELSFTAYRSRGKYEYTDCSLVITLYTTNADGVEVCRTLRFRKPEGDEY